MAGHGALAQSLGGLRRRALLLCLSVALSLAADHYEVLGIGSDASPEEIKKIYKRLAVKLHPDKNKAEDAQQQFIDLQKAYEVLSDPRTRRAYDSRRGFFVGDVDKDDSRDMFGNSHPPDYGRGKVFDKPSEVMAAIVSDQLWVVHIYEDKRELFGDWMRELPDEIKLGHVNVERSRELMQAIAGLHGGRLDTLPFLMLCQGGRHHSFVPPNSRGMWSMFHSVSSMVVREALGFVDYWENLSLLGSDEELWEFSMFRKGGSSRLRVIIVVEDSDERHFSAFAAASELRGQARVAQMSYYSAADARGRPEEFISSFRVTRLPTVIYFDPATESAYTAAGRGAVQQVSLVAEKLLAGVRVSTNLFPVQEFDESSYAWRCTSGRTQCDWVMLLATPAALEGDRDALVKVTDAFSKACESLAALRGRVQTACFWLRLGRAPAWEALLRTSPRFDPSASATIVALGAGRVVLSPAGTAQTGSRAIFRWIRDVLSAGGREETATPLAESEWPALPRMIEVSEEPLPGLSALLAWLPPTWVQALKRFSFQRVVNHWRAQLETADQDVATVFLLLFLIFLLVAWALNELLFGSEDLPSLPDVLKETRFRLSVQLRRTSEAERFGIGIERDEKGGLHVTSVAEGGLLEAWNTEGGSRGCLVRPGDRILSVFGCGGSLGEKGRTATMPEAMGRLLREAPDVTLQVLPASEEQLRRIDGVVVLQGLVLQDCCRFRTWNPEELDLEVADVTPALAAWNQARLDEGACPTQRIEVGDRLLCLNGHVDVARYLAVPNPEVVVAKWRPSAAVADGEFEVVLERGNEEEKWGMQFCNSVTDASQFAIKRVLAPSVAARWNESAASKPDGGDRRVLIGDRVVSVNGRLSQDEMAQELRKNRVVLGCRRWAQVAASRPPPGKKAPTASPPAVARGSPPADAPSAAPGVGDAPRAAPSSGVRRGDAAAADAPAEGQWTLLSEGDGPDVDVDVGQAATTEGECRMRGRGQRGRAAEL